MVADNIDAEVAIAAVDTSSSPVGVKDELPAGNYVLVGVEWHMRRPGSGEQCVNATPLHSRSWLRHPVHSVRIPAVTMAIIIMAHNLTALHIGRKSRWPQSVPLVFGRL